MPVRHPPLLLECQSVDLDLDPKRLHQIADDVAARLVRVLRIDDGAPVRVSVLDDGPNDATQDSIRVSPRVGGGLCAYEWFELLLAHELTHVLVRRNWGLAPVLLWEGLPIHLGDNHVRTRVLGRSYHAYCRALLEVGVLRPLSPLLRASVYYGARRDFRVDVIAGSWSGFLLHTRGVDAVRAFVRGVGHPTDGSSRWVISASMQQHLGGDLAALERAWRGWLLEATPRDDALVGELRAREFAGHPPGRRHCDGCFSPLVGDDCSACGTKVGS